MWRENGRRESEKERCRRKISPQAYSIMAVGHMGKEGKTRLKLKKEELGLNEKREGGEELRNKWYLRKEKESQ